MPPDGGQLQGLRVVDLTQPLGQYCGRLLADLGADVVKVEPLVGDEARRMAPFTADKPPRSLFFDNYNTNKRSLAVDATATDGRTVLERLLRRADVWIETSDLADGGAARALDLPALRAECPEAVLVSLRGFGADGPYADYRPASLVLFAMSGLMHNVGPPHGPPVAAPGQLAYDLAAVDAASGTLMALLARRKTGRGQRVEVNVLEVLGMQLGPITSSPAHVSSRRGNRHAEIAPSGVYECSDGAVEIGVVMPTQWAGLKELLGHPPELEGAWDEREYRRQHADELADFVAARLRPEKRMELVERAQRARLPCLPVNTVADVAGDPHLNARGFFRSTDHLGLSYPRMPGAPFHYGVGGWALRRPAPDLGQHSREILAADLDYSGTEIDRLLHDGIVFAGLARRAQAGARVS
ncbi:MAG: CoA transferase [Chloroflexi bacterium]|nr:CoA transferase [Chloroflexota bacterium]